MHDPAVRSIKLAKVRPAKCLLQKIKPRLSKLKVNGRAASPSCVLAWDASLGPPAARGLVLYPHLRQKKSIIERRFFQAVVPSRSSAMPRRVHIRFQQQ